MSAVTAITAMGVDTIRGQLAAAGHKGDRQGDAGSVRVREQKRYLRELKSCKPAKPMRPVPGRRRSHDRSHADARSLRRCDFDPGIVVLAVDGWRMSLPEVANSS